MSEDKMFRLPNRSAHLKAANFWVVASLVLVAPVAPKPQSVDTTSQAKAHYQSAVTAIAKSDWQIAKSELLQAEKLAPQNALVHYDLALAYLHTGQIKSAQSELDRAVQLGLPAEQRQAADRLKRELRTANVSTNETGGKQNARAQATVAEILDWVKDKVSSEGGVDVSHANTTTLLTETIEHIDGCSFTSVSNITSENAAVASSRSTSYYKIDLSKLRSDVQVKREDLPNGYHERAVWSVKLNVRDPDTYPIEKAVDKNGIWTYDKISGIDFDFPDSSQDIATRVGKALSDAIVKCGGERVKEIY
jgi:tetratricopeptide (TPR) repeat protein